MKQTVPSDRGRTRLPIPPETLRALAELSATVTARSQLLWGEHCTECASPACYAACGFYTPRQDLHCRRFEAGVEPVAAGHGRLSRIRFRRWGKLEARGPAGLRRVVAAEGIERADAAIGAAIGLAPHALAEAAARRWNAAKHRRLAKAGVPPEAFLLEHWSPTDRGGAFTLTFLEETGGGLLQLPFEVGPAYGRLVVPISTITERVDLSRSYLVQIEPIGEARGRDLVLGLADFAAFGRAPPAQVDGRRPAVAAKVVVWDLDETLWNGVLVEDGPDGVRPRPEAVAAIRALDERGVIQSVASKNDLEEALAALRAFGLADYFLYPQVSWGPKSDAVRAIAARLDLGLESIVLIDDQPFERAEVAEALPQVRVLPHTAVADLASHPWFDLPVTAESRERRAMYQAEAKRTAAAMTAGGDYLAFLRRSELRLDAAPLGPAEVERVHELSQRTNQLNFTGAKLTREEVQALAVSDPRRLCLTFRCADRFGDYGLIGFAVLELASARLEAFFMSCRAQRKRVEHAAFAHMAEALAARGHGTFEVAFRATERNRAAVEMLTALGFTADGAGALWRRPLDRAFADADVVRVATPHSAAAA